MSNSFIDNYMASAPHPQYSLIYIYLLRIAESGAETELKDIAEKLHIIESDILNALEYWSSIGLISYADGEISFSPVQEDKTIKTESKKAVLVKPSYSPKEISKIAKAAPNDELHNIFKAAEQILQKTITTTDAEILTAIYDQLNFSDELIAALLVHAKNHSRKMKYIEAIANDWHDRGITTLEAAYDYLSAVDNASNVLKYFGITSRQPSTKERSYIIKWKTELKFSDELIKEACERTLNTLSKVSFDYADGILENWKKKGITTLLQADEENRQFKGKKDNKPKPKNEIKPTYNNKFNDFTQRTYSEEEFKKIIQRKGGI